MKVVHLTVSEGTAPYRVHAGLRNLGVDSSMWVTRRRREDPTVVEFATALPGWRNLRMRLRRRYLAKALAGYPTRAIFEAFVDDRTVYGADLLRQLPPADVIHVHAEHGVADFSALYARIPLRTPVVRTLADEHFFTGGCTQDGGCRRYLIHCGSCPQLGSTREDDLSHQIWARKRRTLSRIPRGRLALVAPSRWLAEEAGRSPLLSGIPITVIPLGVDTAVFRPLDRQFARSVLGIPAGARVVAFVADPIQRVNKGFATLAAAMESTARAIEKGTDVWVVSAGSGQAPRPAPVPHRHLGKVNDERLMALLYSAADVFALPSLQENCPQAAIEALACGIPVVASNTGGVPEIVRPDVGLLIEPGSVQHLSTALTELFQDSGRRLRLGARGREVAMQEYSLAQQAQAYLRVYQTLVGRRSPDGGVSGA